MRRFNITGLCIPEEDYMVDISNKINQISALVDRGCYFTINRARQFGKTTTLNALKRKISGEYTCISMSFEGIGTTMFSDATIFCTRFLRLVDVHNDAATSEVFDFDELSVFLTKICAKEKIVLMIDEVDKASNHDVFIHFLGMLRNKFNERKEGKGATFHSVILAGVHDIKNLKIKMINDGSHKESVDAAKRFNSPWNIAVSFKVDMSFNSDEIATLLVDYQKDNNINFNTKELALEIYKYTSGYPFLVSRICQCVDEELEADWCVLSIQNAVKIITNEQNTLFDDMFKNIENNVALYSFIYELLILGVEKSFVINNPIIQLGHMYGFFTNKEGKVIIANKIFEIVLCEYFISKSESVDTSTYKGILRNDVVKNNTFDMELCLIKFASHYKELYSKNNLAFLERHGRLLFLSFLKPLINGVGFYHIESQFTDLRRMDIVLDYNNEQFIIELKRWRGAQYHEEAYMQLSRYLESKSADKGYLLTFNFTDRQMEKTAWVEKHGKHIFDVIV